MIHILDFSSNKCNVLDGMKLFTQIKAYWTIGQLLARILVNMTDKSDIILISPSTLNKSCMN